MGGVRWGYEDSHGGHDDGVGWTHGHHLGHHLGHNLGTMWTSLGILRPVAMPNYSNCDPAVAKNQRVSILLAAICRPFVAMCRKSAHHRVKPNGRQMVYLPVLGVYPFRANTKEAQQRLGRHYLEFGQPPTDQERIDADEDKVR